MACNARIGNPCGGLLRFRHGSKRGRAKVNSESVVAGVLASPAGVRAVLARDAGSLIRLVRGAYGWRQADLGRRAGFSQPTISRLERGCGRITDIAVLRSLGDVLGIPQAALGLADDFTSRRLPESRRNLPDVQRSEFLRGVLGAAAALALPRAVADDDASHVDDATVRDCQAALERLYELDQRFGGEPVYALAAHMVGRMRGILRRASYPPAVGRALHRVAAATSARTAWLAFDAGRDDDARRWWLESLHLSELGDSPGVRVNALTTMALHACEGEDATGREAVALVDAARRVPRTPPSARLQSLLAARQALGHARGGDGQSAIRSLSAAAALLDHDPDGGFNDEPAWLRFWNPADFLCHETRVALMLGDLRRAEVAARSALRQADAVRYPRNHAIYSARLGSVLVRNGKLEEGISTTRPVILGIRTLGSRRIEREALATVDLLDQHRDYPPAQTFAYWSRRMLNAA